MSNEKTFINAKELAQVVGISQSNAYKVIKQMNDELEQQGFLVFAGKVPRKYFEKRCYGMAVGGNE